MSWSINSGMHSPGWPSCRARSPRLRYSSLYHALHAFVLRTPGERSCRSKPRALLRNQRSAARPRLNQDTNTRKPLAGAVRD